MRGGTFALLVPWIRLGSAPRRIVARKLTHPAGCRRGDCCSAESLTLGTVYCKNEHFPVPRALCAASVSVWLRSQGFPRPLKSTLTVCWGPRLVFAAIPVQEARLLAWGFWNELDTYAPSALNIITGINISSSLFMEQHSLLLAKQHFRSQ